MSDKRATNFVSLAGLMFSLACSVVVLVSPAFPQELWSGQAQCQLTVQSQGYSHQEIQTWTISGAPTASGAMQVYPASWSVSGQGNVQRPQGPQMLAAQWSSNVPSMNAPLAIFVRASDKRLIIKSYHAPLVAPGGVTGVRQVAGAQTSIPSAASEWQFPAIEDVATSANVSGSGTIVVPGSMMPMQFASASSTANCKWQFSKGNNVATPSARTATASQAPTGAGATPGAVVPSCVDPGMPGSPGATPWGTINSLQSMTRSASLSSATDRQFYQINLGPGVEAKVALSGIQTGSDFDLYVYHSDLSPVGCSTTRGTVSEIVTTQLGATQTGNVIIIEVAAHAWSATASSYTLAVSGIPAGTGTVPLVTGMQNRLAAAVANTTGSTTTCADPAMLQGSGSPATRTVLSTINSGQSLSQAGNLASATDRQFYEVHLAAGVDANFALSGIQSGSDFDLYLYHSDLSPIGCSTTRGTASENVATQLGAAQTSNVVIVEVAAYSWSSTAASYKLTVNAITPGTATAPLASAVQNRLPVAVANTTGSTTTCVDPGMGQGSGSPRNPTNLGYVFAGNSATSSASLGSATDRNFYQVTLNPGVNANISVTGIQSGSDFDLYVYHADLSSIGCSTTRGTASESVTTQFGNTQTTNVVIVEVAAYTWSANAKDYTLSIRGH